MILHGYLDVCPTVILCTLRDTCMVSSLGTGPVHRIQSAELHIKYRNNDDSIIFGPIVLVLALSHRVYQVPVVHSII